jgi:aryl-alcohol dehydrogenase-like predicted oxidoreductase
MMHKPSKIALGTAQFGLSYGIANIHGKPDPATVKSLLRRGRAGGICSLDTAIAYGDSEQVLGAAGVQEFGVITKLPEIPDRISQAEVPEWVDAQVTGSLRRMGIERLDGLLLHRPGQLLSSIGAPLYGAMQRQVAEGRVRKIGISIYEPSELEQLMSRFSFDVVQAPFNILDFRLAGSGWVRRLQESGVALHVRSVFLQGLLLMPSSTRPAYFDRWQELWAAWDAWLHEHRLTPLQACLRYALHAEGVQQVVLGVESEAQLEEILSISNEGPLPDGYQGLRSQDADLLNPSFWNIK